MTDLEGWNSLSDAHRELCVKSARTLILESRRYAKRVRFWAGPKVDVENNCLRHRAFETNEGVVGGIDRSIERQLNRLSNEGVERALFPLCVGIWKEGMALSDDTFKEEHDEWALTLLMLRIKDTVELAKQKIACCGSAKVDRALMDRGIIR